MAAQILQAITVTRPSRYIQDVGHAELLGIEPGAYFGGSTVAEQLEANRANAMDAEWVEKLETAWKSQVSDSSTSSEIKSSPVNDKQLRKDLFGESDEILKDEGNFLQSEFADPPEDLLKDDTDDLTRSDNPLFVDRSGSAKKAQIVAYVLEHGLRLLFKLLSTEPAIRETCNLDSSFCSQMILSKTPGFNIWCVLTGLSTLNDLSTSRTAASSSSTEDLFTKRLAKRAKIYSTLMMSSKMHGSMNKSVNKSRSLNTEPNSSSSSIADTLLFCPEETVFRVCSLLRANHRGAREWATRCLQITLKLELTGIPKLSESSESITATVYGEGIGLKPVSVFFRTLGRKGAHKKMASKIF
ncbi:unnamed protein product [Protopolystoma xenopodis]|uniref:Uncharacterized protein n=1 Tax=Protopolystoma xenopodis TaxID=117903 RepID=A0A3S5CHF9_9PLAT|nr:unnamed protein product [Protopolystoma xenopodis]